MNQNLVGGRLLRFPSVLAQTGLSKTEIYRRIKRGAFPQPVKLGVRAVAFYAADIDAWVESFAKQEGV